MKPNLVKWCMHRIKFKAKDVMTEAEREGDIDRAGHDVICSICGHEYIDHPSIEGYPGLHVTCEWRVFKL